MNNNKKTNKRKKMTKNQFRLTIISLFLLSILLIVSTYAWFSTNLNVKVTNFDMVVAKTGGLYISLDGITFDTNVEISEETLFDELALTYPNHTSHWANQGLRPVSTNGLSNNNYDKFDIYYTGGVYYKNRNRTIGYIDTHLSEEEIQNQMAPYIAFDLFMQNTTGSPIPDNLYLTAADILVEDVIDEEMQGLINSFRVGVVMINSVPHEASVDQIQNMICEFNCTQVIFEPNETQHTDLSIERAKKYGINLQDGETFPTYAMVNEGTDIIVNNSVSGSALIDPDYFELQETIFSNDLYTPIYQIPDGISKFRVYVWIEGQDIDSLETFSKGAEVSLGIEFEKDTKGYDEFN